MTRIGRGGGRCFALDRRHYGCRRLDIGPTGRRVSPVLDHQTAARTHRSRTRPLGRPSARHHMVASVTAKAASCVDVVCWDWSGTLLDDVDVARAAMNSVLRDHRLPELSDRTAYREAFGFPVRDFYARLGIPDQDFRAAADRYLALFKSEVHRASLHKGARATLTKIGRVGAQQVLISATHQSALDGQLSPHAVSGHFSQILGITDVYAASKTHVVVSWLDASGHDPRRVLMVGDTNHDEEIADELDMQFLRYVNGHQRPPRRSAQAVVRDLNAVADYVNARHLGERAKGHHSELHGEEQP